MPKSLSACLLAAALSACTTETASLTHVEGSLESDPKLAPVQFSHVASPGGVNAATDLLAIHFGGQPVVFGAAEEPATLNNSEAMVSMYVPPGTGSFAFLRNGETVVTSEEVTLSPKRFNYQIVYGDLAAPKLAVLSSPREPRRINAANVRRDQMDLEITQLDADETALGAPKVLAYGETWSELADERASMLLIAAGEASEIVYIGCNPNFALVSYDDPEGDGTGGGHGLIAPTEPGSDDDAAARCHELTCDCDAAASPSPH